MSNSSENKSALEEEDDYSSSDSDQSGIYIPYRERPEWADVVAMPQDDGPDPVVRIAYSNEFQEVYDYIRAVISTQEISLRAFYLTNHALRLNPANYTVWEYRRRLLRGLNLNLHSELEHMNVIIKRNPKNYQVWHHRRVLVNWIDDPTGELAFLEAVFEDSDDWKNFHAWQHRMWLLSHFKSMSNSEEVRNSELSFTKRLLDADLRNNSVWNYRMFLLRKYFLPEGGINLDEDKQRKPMELSDWFTGGKVYQRLSSDIRFM